MALRGCTLREAMSQLEISAVEYAQSLQLELINAEDERKLGLAAEAVRLLGIETAEWEASRPRYYVDSVYAVDRPKQTNLAHQRLVVFGQTAAEGTFDTFSYVHIGRIIGSRAAVQTLCFSLKDVCLLPEGDLLDEGDVLHIPVLAIKQSMRIS